ncbi:DUF4870 family protein [Pedomonas mirosovicensis]|uniref:DUF4870 family protein n=1 Tax=Pedomonas mirosovicensis TaxID=2908641 RepID=UPI0021691849|nr:hypothetical protein [Pedomonas mirosovicensis]MCH8684160.1 hypothetical protein [Pedomonas mirosovicensis]
MAEDSNYVPEGRQPPSSGFQFNNPTIVSLLYLGGYITGLSALIGLVLAYVWNSDTPADWERSHYRYHIRTFWIGLLQSILMVVAFVTIILIPVAWLLGIWIVVWFAVRTVKAMLAAQKQQPIDNPTTWLW